MNSTQYYFLPSVRHGLAAAISQGASAAHRTQIDVVLQATARVKGTQELISADLPAQTIRLYGPGDILGFHDRIAMRLHPEADVGDFEPNYFPFIEFADPDFAWRFTADSADDQAPELMPWIALVVLVSEDRGDDIRREFEEGPRTDRNLPRHIEVETSALPDLQHAWRWAHVHVTAKENLTKADFEEILRSEPERAVCRVLCPRRLTAGTRYTAFVVPTFKLGVLAGRGLELDPSVNALEKAWESDLSDQSLPYYDAESDRLEMPYYYRWEFRTGLRGDFEQLVRLLEPRKLSGLGLRDIDCARPGFGTRGVNRGSLDAPESQYLGMEGALQSLDTQYTKWGRDPVREPTRAPEPLQADLGDLVNKPEAQRIVVHFTPAILDAGFVVVEPTGNTSVQLTWQTSKPCKVHIDYGETSAYDQSFNVADFLQDHQPILEGLTSVKTYHLKITVETEDGSIAETEDRTFVFPPLPSVVPPIYGRWHRARASITAQNQEEWLDVLNLDPRHRASAGLGSEVIRKQQEPLMASAWEQLGAIESANDILRRAQFGRENSLPLYGRLDQLPTEDFLRVTGPAQKRVIVEDAESGAKMTATHYLGTLSRIPAAALDPAFRRIMRPRGPIRNRQRAGRSANLLTRLASGDLEAAGSAPKPLGTTRPCDITRLLLGSIPGGGTPGCPLGDVPCTVGDLPCTVGETAPRVADTVCTVVADTVPPPPPPPPPPPTGDGLRFCDGRITCQRIQAEMDEREPFRDIPDAPDPQETAQLVCDALDNWLDEQPPDGEPQPPEQPPGFVDDVRQMIYPALDPNRTVVERTKKRLRLAGEIAERFEEGAKGDPLDSIMWAPEFPQPMYQPLRDISHDLLLPGVATIPNNTMGLLETNGRFMESYMCACNHEFAAELLWRGYLTDQRGSYFRQFWDVSNYVPREDELQTLLIEWFETEHNVFSMVELPRVQTERITKRHLDRYLERALDALLGKWLAEPGVTTVDHLTDEQKRVINLRDVGQEGVSEIAEDELNELAAELIKQDRLAEKLRDITPLVSWRSNRLGDNKTRPDENIVLVIRGDLLKRYPNALIYAIDAVPCDGGTGEPVPGLPEYLKGSNGNPIVNEDDIQTILSGIRRVFPVFRATLPPDLTFFGFPFSEEDARGIGGALGKYFIIEEQVTEPRFGLDAPTAEALETWDDLSWSHFGLQEDYGSYLDSGTHPDQPTQGNGGRIWNDESSSATRAWITLQKPVRIAIHATQMLPNVAAYFEVKGPDPDDRFVIKLVESDKIEHARNVLRGTESAQKHIRGAIIPEKAAYNPDWSYHLDPKSIEFFDFAMEVCDATMRYVEEHLEEVGGAFLPGNLWCPWGSELTRELTDIKDIKAVGTLMCRVVTEQGWGIGGATVSVGSTTATTEPTLGRCVLEKVPVGRHTVTATHPEYNEQSQTVILNGGETKTVHFTLVRGTCTIVGTVKDTRGFKISGATVSVGDNTTKVIKGSYFLADVPAGRQTVTVAHPAYKTQSRAVTLKASETTPIDFTLVSATCTIVGTVKDSQGNPKGGATVSAKDKETKTNDQGYYGMAEVPAGRQTVIVNLAGYKEGRKEVTLKPDKSNIVNFILVQATTGTIRGTVKDALDDTIGGATVSAGGKTTITNRQGSYLLKEVPAGRRSVKATHPSYGPKSRTVTLKGGETREVNFTLYQA